MSRPAVSVVMPFGGASWEAVRAVEALRAVDAKPGDELILVDNSGALAEGDPEGAAAGEPAIRIVAASGERSPAHARNAGAEAASNEWVLFLDADCRPLGGVLEAYFSEEAGDRVGALAGGVVAAPGGGLTARYGAARNFLSQQAHLEHPYLPRAVAANLLVRRAAFAEIGGFYEGVRAAEDTDFTWRLQRAGWRLELRAGARVEHTYRASLRELRRQWRGYAAGRAWLARRYEGFAPEPAVARALSRVRGRGTRPREAGATQRPRLERGTFAALDAILALEELAGFLLSNRPQPDPASSQDASAHILVTDRFPSLDDPLAELAAAVGGARVEAAGRPEHPDMDAIRGLDIYYLEDEGLGARVLASATLLARRPVRTAVDLLRRRPGEPTTWALAPAVRRLEGEPEARIRALGGPAAQRLAGRLTRLAGRRLEG